MALSLWSCFAAAAAVLPLVCASAASAHRYTASHLSVNGMAGDETKHMAFPRAQAIVLAWRANLVSTCQHSAFEPVPTSKAATHA